MTASCSPVIILWEGNNLLSSTCAQLNGNIPFAKVSIFKNKKQQSRNQTRVNCAEQFRSCMLVQHAYGAYTWKNISAPENYHHFLIALYVFNSASWFQSSA